MTIEEEFKLLVGAYYGIREIDEYELKTYILADLEKIIRDYVKNNKLNNFDYEYEAKVLDRELSIERRLQYSLLIMNRMDGPLELILLIRKHLKIFKKKN